MKKGVYTAFVLPKKIRQWLDRKAKKNNQSKKAYVMGLFLKEMEKDANENKS